LRRGGGNPAKRHEIATGITSVCLSVVSINCSVKCKPISDANFGSFLRSCDALYLQAIDLMFLVTEAGIIFILRGNDKDIISKI
jgi:hypothetical protein